MILGKGQNQQEKQSQSQATDGSEFQTRYKDLKKLVDALNNADKTWLGQLESKYPTDDLEIQGKIKTLQALDDFIKISFLAEGKQFPSGKHDDNIHILGGLVTELEGYKNLTERYFSELCDLTETDSTQENAVRDARKQLFEKLTEVKQYVFQEEQGTPPSEFDACTDIFLQWLQKTQHPAEYQRTQELFRNKSSDLTESDLNNLINAWGEAVASFVEDAQETKQSGDPVKFGEPETVADFLCIHDRMETLYGRLVTNVSRNN